MFFLTCVLHERVFGHVRKPKGVILKTDTKTKLFSGALFLFFAMIYGFLAHRVLGRHEPSELFAACFGIAACVATYFALGYASERWDDRAWSKLPFLIGVVSLLGIVFAMRGMSETGQDILGPLFLLVNAAPAFMAGLEKGKAAFVERCETYGSDLPFAR